MSKNNDVLSGKEVFDLTFFFGGIPLLFIIALISALVNAIKEVVNSRKQ